jgi:hypothetical protein
MKPTAFLIGFGASAAFVPFWQLGAISARWALLSLVLPVVASLMVHRLFPLLAFVPLAVAMVTLQWTPVMVDGVGAVIPFAVMTFAAVWAAHLDRDEHAAIWRGLIAGLVPSVVAGFFQLAYTFHYVDFELWTTGNYGASGLFTTRVVYGEVAALAFIAALALRLSNWCTVVSLLALLQVGAVGGSREAILAVAVGFVSLALQQRRYWRAVVLLAFIAVTAFIVVAWGYRAGSMALRLHVWSDIAANLRWSGFGLGSFQQMYPLIATQSTLQSSPDHVHNDFLELEFELGVFAAPMLAVVVVALTRVRSPEWPVLLVFIVEACFAFPSYLPVTCLLAGAVLGRLVAAWCHERGLAGGRRLEIHPGVEQRVGGQHAAGFGGGLGALPVGSALSYGTCKAGWPSDVLERGRYAPASGHSEGRSPVDADFAGTDGDRISSMRTAS